MVDRDTLRPWLEVPFESASNRSFLALLATGVFLLALVSVVGRSPATVIAVAIYLLAVPATVAVRVWLWESVVDLEAIGVIDDGRDDDQDEGDEAVDGEAEDGQSDGEAEDGRSDGGTKDERSEGDADESS